MKKLGSGILAIASSTKNICLSWRSQEIKEGDCFGMIGGMVKTGLTVEEGALLEMKEEVGYTGPITLYKAHTFRRNKFEYHNFIGIVPEEFDFHPLPEFAFETDFILWMSYDRVKKLMADDSSDFHPGLLELLRESTDLIQKLV